MSKAPVVEIQLQVTIEQQIIKCQEELDRKKMINREARLMLNRELLKDYDYSTVNSQIEMAQDSRSDRKKKLLETNEEIKARYRTTRDTNGAVKMQKKVLANLLAEYYLKNKKFEVKTPSGGTRIISNQLSLL